jgi:hypothetical protein
MISNKKRQFQLIKTNLKNFSTKNLFLLVLKKKNKAIVEFCQNETFLF